MYINITLISTCQHIPVPNIASARAKKSPVHEAVAPAAQPAGGADICHCEGVGLRVRGFRV